MSTFDVSPQHFADRLPAPVAVLGNRTIQYAITLGQNARHMVARVRAVSATAAINAYSAQSGIPSPFLNASEIC